MAGELNTKEKELDFGQLLNSDPDYLDAQRRKHIVNALINQTMGAQGGVFKKNPLAVFADFMAMSKQKEKIQSIGNEERAIFQKHKDAEAGGTRELIDALSQPDADHRMAIVKALSSQYPGTKKLGEAMMKERMDLFGTLTKDMGSRLDVNSVLAARGNPGALKPAAPLPNPMLNSARDPNGNTINFVTAPRLDGTQQVSMAPVPSSISTTNNLARPGLETLEQRGKYYAEGGEGYKHAQGLQQQLMASTDALRTLENTPQVGAGAEALQFFRKWAEAFSPGISQGLSANTDQLKGQLEDRILKELGGKLGGQVSNTDVQLVRNAIGSIGTDPNALRRIVNISMKYKMRELARMEQQARELHQSETFQNQPMFPGYTFNVPMPSPGQNVGLGFQNEAAQFPGMQDVTAPGVMPPRVQPRSAFTPR